MVIKKSLLLSLKKKIKFGTKKILPFSQGWAIKEVIKRYKIPAKKWGFSGSYIGVETNKQFMFWKDTGTKLVFSGMLNK